jgi:hypothetical protein
LKFLDKNAAKFLYTNLKMVSHRLDKVHKKITKKKGKTPNLHEGSRDTQHLQRAAGRDDKINRLSKLRKDQNRHYRTSRHFLLPVSSNFAQYSG